MDVLRLSAGANDAQVAVGERKGRGISNASSDGVKSQRGAGRQNRGYSPDPTQAGVDGRIPDHQPVAGRDVGEGRARCRSQMPTLAPSAAAGVGQAIAGDRIHGRRDAAGVAINNEPHIRRRRRDDGSEGGGLDEGAGVEAANGKGITGGQRRRQTQFAGVAIQGVVRVAARDRLNRPDALGRQGAAADGDAGAAAAIGVRRHLNRLTDGRCRDAGDRVVQYLNPRPDTVLAKRREAGSGVDEAGGVEGVGDRRRTINGQDQSLRGRVKSRPVALGGTDDGGSQAILAQEDVVLVEADGFDARRAEAQCSVGVSAHARRQDLNVLVRIVLGEDGDARAAIGRASGERQQRIAVDRRRNLVGRGRQEVPEALRIEVVVVFDAANGNRQVAVVGQGIGRRVLRRHIGLGDGANAQLEELLAASGRVHERLDGHG